MNRLRAFSSVGSIAAVVLLISVLSALAVAPTEEAYKIWEQQGVLEQKLAAWQAFKAAGGCAPSPSPFDPARRAARLAAGVNAPDTLPVLVIMVEFTDNLFVNGQVAGTQKKFDSILFSDKLVDDTINPSGSMVDFYREVSYGNIQIKGGVFGPYLMDSSYAWYVNGTDQGFSRSPQLAYDAVTKANADINYSQWKTQTNLVEGVIILHAGPGAETGASNAIWSHKSNIANDPVSYDGVTLTTYTVDPEEYGSNLQPIGVFCHEHGHILGLPDLYDTQDHPRSQGLGGWSLMASGNYNGDSKYPAHPDPWCKRELNWLTFTEITTNRVNVQIPAVEYNPVVYRIRDDSASGSSQYWLVENRQRIGSDYGLPGAGLVIYHVDPARMGWYAPNVDTLHYGIAVEQADGLDQLALAGSRGDAADPWPGSTNNRNFHDQSVPNSHTYANATTQVGVWNISNSDSIMTADLDYTFSRPYITLDRPDSMIIREAVGGNGDGVFDAGETVEFFARINNTMRDAYTWWMTLATDNPDVEFLTNHVRQGLPQDSRLLMRQNNPNVANVPVTFRLKPGSKTSFTTFTLTINADSVYNSGLEEYSKAFQFTIPLGTPNVLVVDDDNNTGSDSVISSIFKRMNIPTRTWSKGSQGSPTSGNLTPFGSVFWVHGKKPTGTLTTADVAALKGYLDNGGNLCMSSATAAKQLSTLDSVFLRDYLHARFIDTNATLPIMWFFGVDGGHLGAPINYKYGNLSSTVLAELVKMTNISPVAPGIKAFQGSRHYTGWSQYIVDTVGVTFSGTYKTVLLTFPIEYLTDYEMAGGWMPRDTILQRILEFFGGSSTGVDNPTDQRLPKSFALGQNFPNPFNPTTIIQYTLNDNKSGKADKVELSVFNMLGEKIVTLVNQPQRPGRYAVEWDGRTTQGTKVASGVYLYRLTRGDESATRKMVLLK